MSLGSNKAGRNASREDVERLLSGSATEEEFGQLRSIVETLSHTGEAPPSEDEVQKFAAIAAQQVPLGPDTSAARAGVAGATVGVAGGLRVRRRRLVMRVAAAAAAVVVVMGGLSGFAYAADGAVPGDTLYGVDLALEKVGIGNGGLQERLTEASQLVARGQVREGLDLASDAVAQSAGEDAGLRAAADALRSATRSVIESQGLGTTEERDEAAERLRQMAAEDSTSEELGQAVEDLAGSLGFKGDTGSGSGDGQNQGGSTNAPGSDTGAGQSPTGPAGSSTTTGGAGDAADGGSGK